MSPSREHRSAPRRAVRLNCQAVRERGFTLLGEVALDVSSHGMLVRTDKRVLTGESVIVSFFEPTELRWYDAEATVARVIHGRRRGERGRLVGLRFDSLRADEQARLSLALERCMWGVCEAPESANRSHEIGESYDVYDDPYGVFASTQ